MVPLRRTLRLHLDDLLGVTRDFLIPHVSRSGLYRCLRRHSVRNPNALKPQALSEPHKAFKSNVPGYRHMDVKYQPQMQDEAKRRYLFVALDRATRWVFLAIKANKSAACPRFSQGPAQDLPDPDHQTDALHRPGVYGPAVCQPRTPAQRTP